MIYLIIYFAIFGIWILIEIIKAPKGYETENSFFLVNPEENSIQADSEENSGPPGCGSKY